MAFPTTRKLVSPARDRLLAQVESHDPYGLPADTLREWQLCAARELFAERRRQIRILDRRARDTGVSSVDGFADLVPLLFSHTTYKSYPQSFVDKGQWSLMLRWFGTLSARPVDDVDVAGVKDVDGFIARLWAAGHLTVTTSGTSGKVSFLNRCAQDDAFLSRAYQHAFLWPQPTEAKRDRHFFMLGPRSGPYQMMVSTRIQSEVFGRPDSIHYLTDDPLNIAYLIRVASMRARIADGSATPQEIADAEATAAAQSQTMQQAFERIADRILALRKEPAIISGPWIQFWRFMEYARAKGIGDGEFHPDTIIASGGGLKGMNLPADYQAQLLDFFGPVRMKKTYGMSELSWAAPQCEAGRYHAAPWVIPLLLDDSGERLLSTDGGVAKGRFAFLDLAFEARWGGVITGDCVSMDHAARCACGRPGPTVLPDIARYADLGAEDKIGCAGTIDAYVRGALSE